jgi:hypothetical protein
MPPPHQDVDFRFAVAARAANLDAAHSIWREALPMSVGRSGGVYERTGTVTYGDYFQAIEAYFQNEGACHLQTALSGEIPQSVPEKIDVILEKHGEFYHPARVQVGGPEGSRLFVLNVAVTPAGFECMHNEVDSLRRVAPRLPRGAVPRIYGVGHVDHPNGLSFWMFLADWFENHHEFHLAVDPLDGGEKIIVWDTLREPFFLTRDALEDVYAQVACLLTRAYDPESTRQIYPWHHASGDFVLRQGQNGVALKLISVRQYAPTLAAESDQALDAESRLMAALVFLANLTLRNRIDRLNGTGKMAWASDAVVAATVAGFKRGASESLLTMLAPALQSYDTNDWVELLKAVGAQYRLMPAEEALLDRHIAAHALCLQAAIRNEFRI